jgi:hypothetical protein
MDGSEFIEQAMSTQRSVASFMLRFTQDLWQDENGDPQVQWRGRINHVQGSEEIPFTDFTEALTFIQRQLQDLTLKAFPSANPEIREKALKESFKLWEQFTAGYADMVFRAMQGTFQQSQEIQGQVGDALAKTFELWMPPSLRTGQPTASAEAPGIDLMGQIETLTAQVAALAAKIESLES